MQYKDLKHLEPFLLEKFDPNVVYMIMGIIKRYFDVFKKYIDRYTAAIIQEIKRSVLDKYTIYEQKIDSSKKGELSLSEKILLFLNEYTRTKEFVGVLVSKKINDRNIFSHIYGFLISNVGDVGDTDKMLLIQKISKWIALEIIKFDLYREIVRDIARKKMNEIIENTSIKKWIKKIESLRS